METRLTVLLIEDLPVYVLLLQKILQQNQISVENTHTLADGQRLAQEHHYDAVLMDLGLPDSQGLNTFITFQSQFPSLPVIILSGLDDENVAARAVKLGAQDYLLKGAYLTQGEAGSKLLVRALYYAVERHQIQMVLLKERSLLEERISERTSELRMANKRLRNLAGRLVSAQEDERRRISLELHDEAGQSLTALKLSLSLLLSDLADRPSLFEQLQDAIALTESTLERLRALAHDLRPPSLDNVGLDQSLLDHCQRLTRHSQVNITYQSCGAEHLPGYVQVSLYRLVQEALSNIIKHAQASRARVQLECTRTSVHLWIQDDGLGFSPAALPTAGRAIGIGLTGMRERVEALAGDLEIDSSPGQGTRIQVYIPLEQPE